LNSQIQRTGESPFDAIRRVRDGGTEYWSARDLMPLMGYSAWRNLEVPIHRAMKAAENQGTDLTSNFAASRKITATKPQDDFELSRFAAYLVAMNGDPNKPEVAAAQSYFAVRTHEAETRPALTGPQLMAAALIEAQATMAQQTERLAIATPKAEAFDAFLSTTGDYSVNEAAKILSRHHDILTGERRLRTWMEANGWIYRQQGQPRAYQRRLEAKTLAEKAQFHYHPETGERVADTPQVRVTARGIEALAKALTKVADQGELDVEGEAS
jgi:DNA-damage-inducible protein D